MASRYWVGGGANTNWITAGNWSATSGGSGGASVPTSADDVIFNGVGATANGTSTISAAITILSITYTSGFTGAMVHTGALSVTGNITLHNNYTSSGSAAIILALGTGTLTSNGRVLTNQLTGAGGATTVTKTLADNWTVNALVINSNSLTLNGFTMTINTTLGTSSGSLFGTTNIVHNGTSWTSTASYSVNNNLTINGDVVLSAIINYGTGTLTINSAIDTYTNGNTLTLLSSPTLNTPGTGWNNIAVNSSQTITLLAELMCIQLVSATAANVTWGGSYGWQCVEYLNTVTSASIVTLQQDVVYAIQGTFLANASRKGSILSFISSSTTVKAKLILDLNADCNVLASFTDIDASGGRVINTAFGVVTDCKNIRFYEDLAIIAKTF